MTRSKRAIFIAATAQHVGKTTACLGLLSGLGKRFAKVGFFKPVGQRHVTVDGEFHVDKDAVLFKERFQLSSPYPDISPVIIPNGFTRNYLDGKIQHTDLKNDIVAAYERIFNSHDYTVVEGTGHSGVGSIIELSNAAVAAALNLDVIMIAPGGLGSAFDQLALNLVMFQSAGVQVRGVILNRVLSEKKEMVMEYVPKALKKWNIPLLGCIPYNEFLSAPTMLDFEQLLQVPLLSGQQHRYRHFCDTRLVATSVENYREKIDHHQLIITPASREDIILATIEDELRSRKVHPEGDLERGMILIGKEPPRPEVLEMIKHAEIPTLYAPIGAFRAMKMITGFTAKIGSEDTSKVEKAIQLGEQHIDFDAFCE